MSTFLSTQKSTQNVEYFFEYFFENFFEDFFETFTMIKPTSNSMNTQKLNPGLEIVLIMEVKCYVITLYSLNQTNLSTSYEDISISKLTNLARLTARVA